MSAILQPELCTIEQYEALPEDKRVEVFDGVIYDMASPSQLHQTILTELLVSPGNIISVPYTFDSVIKVNIYEDLFINFPEIMGMLDKYTQ